MNRKIYGLAEQVGSILKKKGLSIVTAESCTGGLLATSLTDVSGSSSYFDRGFIVYSDLAKREVLGVGDQALGKFGAVSEEVAYEMAQGALERSRAKISVAITGIAGPAGGSQEKPVGTVCFSFIGEGLPTKTITKHFVGNRNSIREQAVEFVLKYLLENI